MDRVEVLRAMLASDPKNTFARYGLAMEFTKAGKVDEAIAEYKTLLENDANYAAAYFHGGQALEQAGRVEEARDWYERGIEVTRRTGDGHTQSELQAALDLLPI
jgi:tetratricopeptide (TPR) repeat protein